MRACEKTLMVKRQCGRSKSTQLNALQEATVIDRVEACEGRAGSGYPHRNVNRNEELVLRAEFRKRVSAMGNNQCFQGDAAREESGPKSFYCKKRCGRENRKRTNHAERLEKS